MKNNVVGQVLKVPSPEELIEMYETLDKQVIELRAQFRRGALDPRYVQAIINHRNPWPEWHPSYAPLVEAESEVPNLRSTGPTLAHRLQAREELHKFLTGEIVFLQDMFEMSDVLLARTDLMPAFCPTGTTHRMVIDWKKKLGIRVCEDKEVTQSLLYPDACKPIIPRLHLLNWSQQPDHDTLGDNAKSPNELMMSGKVWADLYDWADADSLYWLITGNHFDVETWTSLSYRISDTTVARGYCLKGEVRFNQGTMRHRNPRGGARAVIKIPLRKQS